MQVEPDARSAREDERGVLRLVRAGLSRVLPRAVLPPDHEIAYPGYHAAAHRAQRVARTGTPSPEQLDLLYAELRAVDARARASAARRTRGGGWPVDLPPAEGHLTESLDRARACVPQRPERSADLAALTVAPWGLRHRLVFDEAVGVLGRVWPRMLAEVSTVVRQVALLDGWGIDGFTDFTVHGVVFVNSARVTTPDGPPDGGHGGDGGALPAPLPLVEALVHEGTHNRCDAAAVTGPFLADTPTQLLRTPLRPDPRPLTGLFQQVVVLARSVLLYERLLAAPDGTVDGARAEVEARRDLLLAQGLDGCTTLDGQRGALADHGRSVAAQARHVLEWAAR
ncbi:HEXXH motif-containing putative peptide modification protein [Kitasatospora sp. NPDC056783]|uniref:aKG-HExxH-type peptide beta-hydroxylase n=1 Tax=Kitasatospora sp. NPDC056783 TaxID=3345943 RepID=UPI003676D0DE